MKPVDGLTQQEVIVLALVAKGWRNAKIAQELVISPRTVETHVYRILDKLDVSSRTEATLYAFRSGLVSPYEVSRNADDAMAKDNYASSIG